MIRSGIISQQSASAPPVEDRIIAINFTDTTYTQAPSPWNNIYYSDPVGTGSNIKDTSNVATGISVSSISSFNGSSDEQYSGTLPIPEIYSSDWWGSDSNPPIQVVMSGFDPGKKYKFKIIGSIESTGITKYNLVNDSVTAIPMGAAYPNSSDLTSDTNYVVLNGEGQSSYTIYGWRVADQYKSLVALIIEEYDEAPPVELVSIEIEPLVQEIQVGGSQQYSAIGTFSDSSTSALSNGDWSSTDTDVITVSSGGLVNGESEGTADVEYTAGPIVGSLEITVTPAPVGRTINVGSGSGMLNIDMSNLTYMGSPTSAQDGDTIVIAPGTYSSTSWPLGAINISNANLVTGFAKITTNGVLNINGEIHFLGGSAQKGVDLDFRGQTVNFTNNYAEKIRLDVDQFGGYERIKIRGFSHTFASGDNYFIRHYCSSINYPVVAIKDLEISDINFTGSAGSPIVIGNTAETISSGYCENVSIHHINVTGPASVGSYIKLGNTEGFDIHHIYGLSVNMPETTAHGRFIYAFGRGDMHHIRVSESGGAAAIISMFSRQPDQVCRIYNVMSYDSRRYSTAEFRSISELVVDGQTYVCKGEGDFVSFYTTQNTGVYGCSAFDIYDDISTEYEIRNSVAVNPQQGGSGQIWNGSCITPPNVGPSGTWPNVNKNYVSANNSLTLLGTDMVPAAGSALIGEGVSVVGITTDYYDQIRPNPPSIGAVEP